MPPPLPASLSSRLLSTIDPATGTCKHHPAVKLCELVQNDTRWVVRRKICYKCGTANKGRMHRPGVAVRTGEKERRSAVGSGGRRSMRESVSVNGRERTRSTSVSRRTTRARSASRERSRSTLAERPSRSRPSSGVSEVKIAPQAVAPPQAAQEDFDESDPIIYIPAPAPSGELPPPPPRTDEEAERHAERLEMRRVHEKEDKKRTKNEIKVHAEPAAKSHSKPRRQSEKVDVVMPSATAMALLESHGKDKKNKSPRKDDASETSSISTASAKMYPLEPDELRAVHPELDGVITSREPPRTVVPRARSVSRPRERAKKSVDPQECRELVPVKRERSRKTVVAVTNEREQDRAKSVDRRRRVTVDEKKLIRNTVTDKPKSSKSLHGASSRHLQSTKSLITSRSELQPLSASAARISRRRQSTTQPPRESAARSRSRSRILREAAECCSVLEQSTKISKSRSKHDASGITACTQPLSVSSDEIFKAVKNEQPVVYKKRARKSEKKSPVAHVDVSEDEKSHASSISSSSTVEESFACSDDEKGDRRGVTTARASSVLKDVKGSAVGLASKGRSTLIGLKGTSKKWQSALFM